MDKIKKITMRNNIFYKFKLRVDTQSNLSQKLYEIADFPQ